MLGRLCWFKKRRYYWSDRWK